MLWLLGLFTMPCFTSQNDYRTVLTAINASQLAKMKKYIPHMSLHAMKFIGYMYNVEALGLKNYNYTFKITISVNM